MFQPSEAILRDCQHNMCPDANTWKSEHIYMEVKLTIKYNIKGVNTYNLKSLNMKIKYKTMIIKSL
jgi:hypothetical protein